MKSQRNTVSAIQIGWENWIRQVPSMWIKTVISDQSFREVARGASTALIVRISGAFLGVITSLIVARMLGAEGSGVYYLSMSIVVTASTFGRLGLDTAAVKHVASYAAEGDWAAVAQVARLFFGIVLSVSIFISLMLMLGAPWLAKHVFGKANIHIPLLVSACAVAPFSWSFVIADALRGLRRILAAQLIKNSFVVILTLLFIYPASKGWGSNGAVISYVAAVMINSAIAFALWRRGYADSAVRGNSRTGHSGSVNLSSILMSSWPFFGVAIGGLVIEQCATLSLGILGSASDVGIFSVANRITNILLFPLLAMISILSPKFAAMHRVDDLEGLRRLARQSSAILIAIIVPMSLAVFVWAEKIMSLFGEQFISGTNVLRILILGVVVNVATGAVAEILMMTGFGTVVRNINIAGAVFIAVFCYILIPPYGTVGAAITVASGVALLNIALYIMVWRRLGFHPLGIK